MDKRAILPLILLSLILVVSGCTITITGNGGATDNTGSGGTGSQGNTENAQNITPITSVSVSSVVVTGIRDSEGNTLYSGASTSDELVIVLGRVVATGDVGYSTVLSHNGEEQFVHVESDGTFESAVSMAPGQNTFQIIVRDLEGNIIGRSSQYTLGAAEIVNEVGETVSSAATDMRVTLTWNTDGTDVDLHVVDPNNCEAYYGDKTAIHNAELDVDDTDGFGPEIFTLNQSSAVIGTYRVFIDYYSSHGVTEPVDVTVRVQIKDGAVQTFTHTFTTDEGAGANWNVGNFTITGAAISATNACAAEDTEDTSNAFDNDTSSNLTTSADSTIVSMSIQSVGGQTSSGMTITSTDRVVTVTGLATWSGVIPTVILYVNDVPQYVEVSAAGQISESTVLSAGTNTLRLAAINSEGVETFSSTTWTITASSVNASDLTVVLSWDTNFDDIDLHVIGPTEVETYYGYDVTTDGVLDIDDVDGYGPETFTLASTAPNGVYQIIINYFGNYGEGSYATEDSHITVTVTTGGTSNTYTHTFTPDDEYTDWHVTNVTITR